MAEGSPTPARTRARRRAIAFIVVIVGLALAGRTLDVPDVVATTRHAVHEAGVWAPAAFGGGYVVATLLGVPGTPLTVLAALLFGPWVAFVVMVTATTTSSIVAFVVARYVARDAVEAWLGADHRFVTARRWVEERPWLAIPLLRILPLFPYTLNNYGLGLTRLPLWKYLLASELAMVPMNAVWIGAAGTTYHVLFRGETPWPLVLGTTGAGLLLLLILLLGRRALGSYPEA